MARKKMHTQNTHRHTNRSTLDSKFEISARKQKKKKNNSHSEKWTLQNVCVFHFSFMQIVLVVYLLFNLNGGNVKQNFHCIKKLCSGSIKWVCFGKISGANRESPDLWQVLFCSNDIFRCSDIIFTRGPRNKFSCQPVRNE